MLDFKCISENKYNLNKKCIKQLMDFIADNISYKDNITVLYGLNDLYILVNGNVTYKFYILPLPNYEINDYEDTICLNCPENPEIDPITL